MFVSLTRLPFTPDPTSTIHMHAVVVATLTPRRRRARRKSVPSSVDASETTWQYYSMSMDDSDRGQREARDEARSQ